MMLRTYILVMLLVMVLAPIVLYTDRFGSFNKPWSSRDEFKADVSASDPLKIFEGPTPIIYADNLSTSDTATGEIITKMNDLAQDPLLPEFMEHKSRSLHTLDNVDQSDRENPINQVTDEAANEEEQKDLKREREHHNGLNGRVRHRISKNASGKMEAKQDQQSAQSFLNYDSKETVKPNDQTAVRDARVRRLKDQLIRAKIYLSLPATKNNPHFIRELRVRIKEIQRALGDATKDSELSRNSNEKLNAMEQTLAKGKQLQDDCAVVVKKLRAMLHSTEEQLRVHRKQTTFLTQLTTKALPKGLHCLPLRLSYEYYALNSQEQVLPNQEKVEDPSFFHYALFSDNILAAAVVVNSTVFHAQDPSKLVFHIVTDKLNYAAMRMWFLANPPGNATVQIQNVEEFTWLNSSYSPVLKQLDSQSMINYYFKAHHANSDSSLKFRNPKYLSILNHLRFYLPEIFPKLDKVLFLDDDVVVQKDLSSLWSIDLEGNVNGAVETCGEIFHRFDHYLNFSNPLISKNFDPHACGWAYGMNIFDLKEWKRQNVTQFYHNWQKLNHNRQLWKLGTLPPGLITFWKRTHPLDHSWHVLGLGYNPNVGQKEIEQAAVIHYNGNLKPWLEISIPRYRSLWTKFIDYDRLYLRDCNINP